MNKGPNEVAIGDHVRYVHANEAYQIDFVVKNISNNFDLSARLISTELYDNSGSCQAKLWLQYGHYVTVEV